MPLLNVPESLFELEALQQFLRIFQRLLRILQRFVDLADEAEWKKAAEDLMQNWKTALSKEAEAAKTDS